MEDFTADTTLSQPISVRQSSMTSASRPNVPPLADRFRVAWLVLDAQFGRGAISDGKMTRDYRPNDGLRIEG